MLKKFSFKIKLAFILVISVMSFFPGPSAPAAVPSILTYQGILKDSSGNFLTGTYSIVFKIHSASSGGSVLWSETQSSVSAVSGKFTVQLGSVTPVNLAFDVDYWLGITVGADSEMSPRVKLTSAGYAYMAEDVTGGKLSAASHAADSHLGIEGVRAGHTTIAKTNFKIDAYSLSAANNMSDLYVDVFTDSTGIDSGSSSSYYFRGSPNYDVTASGGGNDSYVGFLLHSNGTDASTSFPDSSSTSKSVTANGNAQVDTAQSRFGSASGYFDGTGDYLTASDSSDFDFSGGVWTVDCWVRVEDLSATRTVWSHQTDSNNRIDVRINTNGTSQLLIQSGGSQVVSLTASTSHAVSTGVWAHIEVGEDGDTYYLAVNGNMKTGTDTDRPANYTGTFQIGVRGGSTNPYQGWVDELRVSKGVIRHTSNFSVPTDEYGSGASGTVISTAFTQTSAPSEVIVIPQETLGSGSVTYSVSRNNGTNWTTCTKEQRCDISSQPTGTQVKWKAAITGDAELDAVAVSL